MRVRLSQLVLGPVLLLGLVSPHAVQAAPHGKVSRHSYTAPGGLTRTYLQYVPAGLRANRPVVVFLHGCNETATEAMAATGFNALADKEKFAVVYPEQVRAANSSAPVADGNGIGCWNWRMRFSQAITAGLTASIAPFASAE